jgi:predicted phosphoribosyltransferase
MSQVAACAHCENLNCPTVVVIPAVPDTAKRFDFQRNCLEIACPVCQKQFSISVGEIDFRNVSDEDLRTGYLAF